MIGRRLARSEAGGGRTVAEERQRGRPASTSHPFRSCCTGHVSRSIMAGWNFRIKQFSRKLTSRTEVTPVRDNNFLENCSCGRPPCEPGKYGQNTFSRAATIAPPAAAGAGTASRAAGRTAAARPRRGMAPRRPNASRLTNWVRLGLAMWATGHCRGQWDAGGRQLRAFEQAAHADSFADGRRNAFRKSSAKPGRVR